jgi:hypothetical protein
MEAGGALMTKWVKRGGKATRVEADGEVRRSQAIRAYGAGSLMDLVDRAVLFSGLDFWRFGASGAEAVRERRLRDAVVKMLSQTSDLTLSKDKPFVRPPAGLDGTPSRDNGVEVFEFPQWFVCQNTSCRRLIQAPYGLEEKGGRWQHFCETPKGHHPAVPVRFVLACRNGHLDEMPWNYFVHEGQGVKTCDAPTLKLIEGKTGDFSEVVVRCACGQFRLLANARAEEANPPCRGLRPWLGPEAREDCDQRPRMLMRGASNTYFSQVVSALSIPEFKSALVEKVKDLQDVLTNATPETLPVLRQAIPKLKVLEGESDADILDAIKKAKGGTDEPDLPLRTAEFLELTSQPPYRPGALPAPGDTFFARRYASPQGAVAGVRQVVLAPRLREVAVQVGFTRLEAPTANLQGEYDLAVSTCRLGLNTDWLPASENWGEGVFLQLDEDVVRSWEDRRAVRERTEVLVQGYKRWAGDRTSAPDFPGVRFYLLHTLSHLLINAISVECGYSASALSERIYCAPRNDDTPMAAILISTGTPGTEGTLGGLVEQGKNLLTHLQRAFDLGRLCSNDPVCAYHSPVRDPTRREREGAACHGCLYVAEPSCERFNVYLDRALVVPTMGHPSELAFFTERPAGAR